MITRNITKLNLFGKLEITSLVEEVEQSEGHTMWVQFLLRTESARVLRLLPKKIFREPFTLPAKVKCSAFLFVKALHRSLGFAFFFGKRKPSVVCEKNKALVILTTGQFSQPLMNPLNQIGFYLSFGVFTGLKSYHLTTSQW